MSENPTVASFDTAFVYLTVSSVVVLALVTFFMVWFCIRYSRTRNPNPSNIEGNVFAETLWTVIPTIIFMGMFYFGMTGFQNLRTVPEGAMTIDVTGQMWMWTYKYENGVEVTSLEPDGVLRVPVGRPVKVRIHATDVLHSFYIPAFRVKEDAVPGIPTYLWFVADRPGEYDIFCAEYCGLEHSKMLSKVVAMEPTAFEAWYAKGGAAVKAEAAAAADTSTAAPDPVALAAKGEKLYTSKGCVTCHTIDGSPRVGPTFKGLFGKTGKVVTNGKEREVLVDAEYIRRSTREPNVDVAVGFVAGTMPPQTLTDQELDGIIAFLESIQ